MQGRKVRIVKPRTLPRSATLSLALAAGVAAVLLALWQFWQEDEVPPARQRVLNEWQTDWKCEVGHIFHAAGQIEPRVCWTCDRPAYAMTYYKCPVHGAFEVTARFAEGADGRAKAVFLRLPGRQWTPVEKGLICPRGDHVLVHSPEDPVQILRRREGKPGG